MTHTSRTESPWPDLDKAAAAIQATLNASGLITRPEPGSIADNRPLRNMPCDQLHCNHQH